MMVEEEEIESEAMALALTRITENPTMLEIKSETN